MSSRLAYSTSTGDKAKPGAVLRHHPKSALAMIANAAKKSPSEVTAEAQIVEAQVQADIVPTTVAKIPAKRTTAKMPPRVTDGKTYPVTVTTVEERALANLTEAGVGFEVVSVQINRDGSVSL